MSNCLMRLDPAQTTEGLLSFVCRSEERHHVHNIDKRIIPSGYPRRFITRKFFWVGRG